MASLGYIVIGLVLIVVFWTVPFALVIGGGLVLVGLITGLGRFHAKLRAWEDERRLD